MDSTKVTQPDTSGHLKEHWDTLWDEEVPGAHTVDERLTDPFIGIQGTKLLNEVLEVLKAKSNPTILESGCGQGIWIIELQTHGYDPVGIDYSLPGLAAGARYRDGLRLVNGNILGMPFRDQCFDVVLSWGVVEHFEDPARLSLSIQETFRILRLGGHLLITVPVDNLFLRTKNGLRRMPGLRTFARPDPPFFERKFRVKEFLGTLKDEGFEISAWRYHATEFGLAVTYPRLFQKQSGGSRYFGLSVLGKILHAMFASWMPFLTAHQLFVVARKRDT